MKDSIVQSFFRGRAGSVVLAMASAALTAYGVSADEQAVLYQAGSIALAGGAALMAAVSKWRESRK